MNDTDGTYYDICQASKLEYYLHGLDTLTQLLQVAGELVAETGMQDWIITHRGRRLRYCWQDAKAAIARTIDGNIFLFICISPLVFMSFYYDDASRGVIPRLYRRFVEYDVVAHQCERIAVAFPGFPQRHGRGREIV